MRVDANLDRRLQAAAAREGQSVSAFVREAITERLDRVAVDSSLWDRIAPSVLEPRPRGLSTKVTQPRKRDTSVHEEFAAGLEADAATKWQRDAG